MAKTVKRPKVTLRSVLREAIRVIEAWQRAPCAISVQTIEEQHLAKFDTAQAKRVARVK